MVPFTRENNRRDRKFGRVYSGRRRMNRREVLNKLSVMAAAVRIVNGQQQAPAVGQNGPSGGRGPGPSMPIPSATRPASYPGRLTPGVVAMSFRGELESGKYTYEDIIRISADLGLEGLDLTGYYVPPKL